MVFLNNFISSMSIADAIIYFFMLILVVISFKNKKNTIIYANFIAALGMIGTFLGICIGLSDFNPNDITKSIPVLLQGMKTAFFTSLIGMSISIILKFLQSFTKEKIEVDTTEDAILKQTEKVEELNENIKEMTNVLKDISDLAFKDSLRIKAHDTAILELTGNLKHLELVKEALKDIDSHIGDNIKNQYELSIRTNELLLDLFNSSEEIKKEILENKKLSEQIIESSSKNTEMIVTRITENITQNIEKITVSNTEILKVVESSSEKAQKSSSELVLEFRDFAKTMAENNNKAFIQALNESMKDLNIKLTEQFGENFKELNKAVFKLVEWQEHYKNTVIETTENQKVIFDGISKAKDDLAQFVNKGEQVSQIADNLQQTIDITKEKQAEFNTELQVLSEINKSAKELIPTFAKVNNSMDENLNIFKNSLDEISSNINEVTKDTVNDFQKTYSEFSNNINQSTDKFNLLINENAMNFEKVSTETIGKIQQIYSELSKVITSSKDEFGKILTESSLVFKENNEKIISSTNEQVINAISQLDELSRRLVEESNIKTQGYIENINLLFEKAIDSLKQMNINLEKEGTEITTKTSQSIEQLNAQVNENLKTSVENIKNGLEIALNASLTSLGDELAILSNKFVKDYTPLTEQLRDIISISKGARR